MRKMKLGHMFMSFIPVPENQFLSGQTPDRLVSMPESSEWDARYNLIQDPLIRDAGFRFKTGLESDDQAPKRMLDKNQINRAAGCGFIEKSENGLITGSNTSGKSFPACATGKQDCSNGRKVLYSHTKRLKMTHTEKQDLLITANSGTQPQGTPCNMALMEVIENRRVKKPTLHTLRLQAQAWHKIAGAETIAHSTLDRVAIIN